VYHSLLSFELCDLKVNIPFHICCDICGEPLEDNNLINTIAEKTVLEQVINI
jgi:hypothetical protein